MHQNLLKLKQLDEEEQKRICNAFLSYEKTCKQLSDEYDVPDSTMKAFLKLCGVNVKEHLQQRNDAKAEAAMRDYMSGMLMKDVAVKHQICGDTVYNYMNRKGIHYKNDHGRKNFFNKNYFHNIDREDKAYFLGFLYADGWIGGVQKNVYERPCNIVLDLSSRDRAILEQFLVCIEASGNTHIRDYIASDKTYKAGPMSAVSITSTVMADDLISHGFAGLKTTRLLVPDLPENTYRHFVRGYFDGDGCTTTNTVQFTGTTEFLHSLHELMKQQLHVTNGKIASYYDNKNVSDLSFYTAADRQSIFSWFYDSSSIYLQRKKDHFQDTLK